MGRESFAYLFYTQDAWRDCRKAYAASKGWLCEDCLDKGLIVPGEIVHHKTPLTPDNIGDASVAYGWDNLRLVCRSCHRIKHGARSHRWKVRADGRVETVGG